MAPAPPTGTRPRPSSSFTAARCPCARRPGTPARPSARSACPAAHQPPADRRRRDLPIT